MLSNTEYEVGISELQNEEDSTLSSYEESIDLYYNNWIWRAVHVLVEHPNFKPKATWIADTLSISVGEAIDALEGLEELGLIRRHNSTYVSEQLKFLMPEEKNKKEFTIRSHKSLSQQILAKSNIKEIEGSMDYFLIAEPKRLYSALREVLKKFENLSLQDDQSSDSQLYAITMTCTNLAPKMKGNSNE